MIATRALNTDKYFIIVTYDIIKNKHRYRVMKILKGMGFHVQKSVFECRVNDRLYLKMKNGIEQIIDWEVDSIRYYTLCAGCVKNVELSGVGFVREDEDVIVV